jgi:hypothetical protein
MLLCEVCSIYGRKFIKAMSVPSTPSPQPLFIAALGVVEWTPYLPVRQYQVEAKMRRPA